jgi:DNA-directed RNA polymerase specialized sigma24 family protein
MALDPKIFMPMVKQIAASVSRQFPSSVDMADTEQHLWVWLYDKRTSVLQTVEDNPNEWESMIASTMRKVAFDHCAKEKAAAEGYSTEDLFRYSIPKIKALLPDVFDYSDWQSFGLKGDGQPGSKPQANRTGDRMVELIDIKAGVKRLPIETRELLYLTHVMHYSTENLAEHFEVKHEAAKKRLQRAYGAVQRVLGRKDQDDQPRAADRRMVRSNAAARAALSTQYEGA